MEIVSSLCLLLYQLLYRILGYWLFIIFFFFSRNWLPTLHLIQLSVWERQNYSNAHNDYCHKHYYRICQKVHFFNCLKYIASMFTAYLTIAFWINIAIVWDCLHTVEAIWICVTWTFDATFWRALLILSTLFNALHKLWTSFIATTWLAFKVKVTSIINKLKPLITYRPHGTETSRTAKCIRAIAVLMACFSHYNNI